MSGADLVLVAVVGALAAALVVLLVRQGRAAPPESPAPVPAPAAPPPPPPPSEPEPEPEAEPEPVAVAQPPEPALEATPAPPPSDCRILVVDDEPALRTLLTRILDREGYQVLEAPGGLEALELFETADPPVDLILSDVIMPRLNGVELVQRARAVRPDVAVLLLSGFTPAAIARHGLETTDDLRLLQKPVEPSELLAAVEAALRP